MHQLFLTAICAFLALGAAAASAEPVFPRLAGINIGSPHSYDDPAYQRQLARLDTVILGIWPGWERTRSMPMEQVARNIKGINPNTRVFLYVINNELEDGTNDAWSELRGKLDESGWWLYRSGSSGERVPSTFGRDYIINNTMYSRPDSTGRRFVDWFAEYTVQKFYRPNPTIDGFFTDNVFWKPRVDGDWNRDGQIDSKSSATAAKWHREGYRRHFERLRALMPGKPQIGNIADWGERDAVLTEFKGMLNGGVLEGMIGASYSPESWSSWHEMMRWYRKSMDALAWPRIAIFNQHGNPSDYRAFRYGFASCLLDDGYYSFTDTHRGYAGVAWFDEYDVGLGQAVSAPPTKAWKSGVYRREFERGIVLVNPKGNGAVDIELETDYRRIRGTQDPVVNNGQVTRRVRLQDRDGLVLLRMRPRPKPPANLEVEG